MKTVNIHLRKSSASSRTWFRVYDETASRIGRDNPIVVFLCLCIESNVAVNWNKRLVVIQRDDVMTIIEDLIEFHWKITGK